jgi:hypothetical protein
MKIRVPRKQQSDEPLIQEFNSLRHRGTSNWTAAVKQRVLEIAHTNLYVRSYVLTKLSQNCDQLELHWQIVNTKRPADYLLPHYDAQLAEELAVA